MNYIEPTFEVIELSNEDVVRTSGDLPDNFGPAI